MIVQFKVADDEASPGVAGEIYFESLDVSSGGAFLRSDLLFEPGDLLEVSFVLPPHGTKVRAQARVVWATHKSELKGDTGMAVEFVELSDQARAAIDGFVKASDPVPEG